MSRQMNLPTLSLRLDFPNGQRIGPGKITLLKRIAELGSISAAARSLEMSYPKALKLVEQMNGLFFDAVVEKHQGGNDRGGALLTDLGEEVINLYDKIVSRSEQASCSELQALMDISTKSENI